SQGYTEHENPVTRGGVMNTPSLMNCVYNTHQFWDGRATALEEVVQRRLDDERPPAETPVPRDKRAEWRHAWSGVVGRLRRDPEYVKQFQAVFGNDPTQDGMAKALATYLRTILSGNSLYDRAEQERARRRAREVEVRDFEKVVTEAALPGLERPKG